MPHETPIHVLTGDPQTAAGVASRIPERVRAAIRVAARDERAYSIACRLFVEDAVGGFGDTVSAARLEHAIARSMLDAWSRGQSSAEGVGAAYAAVGDRVARGRDDTSHGE